ncbi:MAG TPA: hypothetical protein VH561_09230 [Micromonosporaceae bacterium]
MAARVVLDVPSGGRSGFLRGLGVLLGSVLVAIGVIATPFTLLFAVGFAADYAGIISGDAKASDVLWSLLALVVTVVLAWLGLRLIRGRRRLGLYLRKFGYGDSTRAVTGALTSAVGRRVRVVTLDDAMVTPVPPPRWRRRLAGLALIVFTGVVVYFVLWVRGGGIERSVANGQHTDPGQADNIKDSFGAAMGNAFADAIGMAVLLVLIGFVMLLAGGIAVFAAGAWVAAIRAGRFTRRTIDTESAIAPIATRIGALSRKIFSPRLFVTRVTGPIWQAAVRGLGAAADVVIIDVSHPTDPLLWEVETMKLMFGDRWVLVGAYEHVGALGDQRTAAGTDNRARLARLLDGEEIIAYGHAPADRKRFIRALRNRLYRKTPRHPLAPTMSTAAAR